jgi:hypothetical protein
MYPTNGSLYIGMATAGKPTTDGLQLKVVGNS